MHETLLNHIASGRAGLSGKDIGRHRQAVNACFERLGELLDNPHTTARAATLVRTADSALADHSTVEAWLKQFRDLLRETAGQVPGRWSNMGYMPRAVHASRACAIIRSATGLPAARKKAVAA